MKKSLFILLLIAVLACCCGCGQSQLPEGFDEATLKAKAEEVVLLVAGRDYESLCSLFREDLAAELTPDYLAEQLDGMLDESGAFVKFRATACAGQQTEAGEDYAVVMALTKFEDHKRTFTISFDQNMELIGLYMK